MTDTSFPDWVVAMEAAMRIGCSTRTIERLARAGKLEQRLRPRAGSPPVAVYNPADVARLAAERRPAPRPFVLGAVQEEHGNGRTHTPTSTHMQTRAPASLGLPAEDLIRGLAVLLSKALQSPPSPPVSERVAETVFLTVEEAAAYSGLTPRDLRRAVRTGELPARHHGRRDWRTWRIRRKDLEAL